MEMASRGDAIERGEDEFRPPIGEFALEMRVEARGIFVE